GAVHRHASPHDASARNLQTARPENFLRNALGDASRGREHPWFIDEVCKPDLAAPRPPIPSSGDDHSRFVEQNFGVEVFLLKRYQYSPKDEVHIAITQFPIAYINCYREFDMNREAWVALVKQLDGGGQEASCHDFVAGNAQFTGRRIG